MNKQKKNSKLKIPFQIFAILILLCVLSFCGLFGYVCYAEKHVKEAETTDAIIVLGAQVKEDGSLSVQLQLRLETALAEYQKQPRPIVCCGGQAGTEPAPEGEVMAKWLIAQGVLEEHAIAETTSTSTEENLKNAKALLGDSVKTVLIVTSDYHLARALAMARDAGLTASGAAAPTMPEYWLKNRFRETLAWGKYLLKKILP